MSERTPERLYRINTRQGLEQTRARIDKSLEQADQVFDRTVAQAAKGCGCSILLAAALALFGATAVGSCTARIPRTETNITAGFGLGSKRITEANMSTYLVGALDNRNQFISQSAKLVLGPIEAVEAIITGNQPDAPNLDVDFKITATLLPKSSNR